MPTCFVSRAEERLRESEARLNRAKQEHKKGAEAEARRVTASQERLEKLHAQEKALQEERDRLDTHPEHSCGLLSRVSAEMNLLRE